MADVVRTITIRGTTQGVDETIRKLQKLAGAQQDIAAVSERTSRSQLSVEKALERRRRELDVNYRSTKQLESVQRDLDRAVAQGLINQQQHNTLMNLAAQRFGVAAQKAGLASTAYREFSLAMEASAARAGGLGNVLSSIGPKAAVAGAAIIGVAVALVKLQQEALRLAEVAGRLTDVADSTKLSTDALQGLELVASQVGITAEQMSTMLERLARNWEQARRGSGELVDELKRVDAGLLRQIQEADNLQTVLDLLSQAYEKSGRSALLARAIFGARAAGAGGRLLGGISETGGLDRTIKEMEKLGLLNRDALKQWDQMGDRINFLGETGRRVFASIFATPFLKTTEWVAEKFAQMAKSLKDIADRGLTAAGLPERTRIDVTEGQISDIDRRRMEEEKLRAALERRAEAMRKVLDLLGPSATMQQKLDAVEAELASKIANTTDEQEKAAAAQRLRHERATAAEQIEERQIRQLGELATIEQKVRLTEIELNRERRIGLGLSDEVQRKVLEFKRAQEESARANERASLGLGTFNDALAEAERRLSQLVARGVISETERSELRLRTQIQSIREMVPAFKQAEDAAMSFAQTFLSGLLQGQSLLESLENSLRSLSQTLLQGAFTQLSQGNLLGAGIYAAFAAGTALFGHMLRNDREERERQQRIADNRAQNLGLHRTLLGVIPGSVSENIQNVFEQVVRAGREAAELGDTAEVIRLGNEFQAFVQRTLQEFRDGLPNLITYLRETSQLNNAYAQAAQQMRQLGDALRGIGADISAAGLGGTQQEAEFLAAAQGAVLAMVRGADEVSDLQAALQAAQGAAHEAVGVLQQLGMSAEEAARAVDEQLIIALDRLRRDAVDELTRDINDLVGRGHLNEMADLIKELAMRTQDFIALGLPVRQVQVWFQLAAQDLVDNAQLTGAAFQELLRVFPELNGLIHEFSADSREMLSGVIERMKVFIDQIREFRRSLLLGGLSPLSPAQRFAEAQARFRDVAARAARGDEKAFQDLQDVSQQYLDESKSFYASSEQYFAAFNEVQSALLAAENSAVQQLTAAEQQINLMNQQIFHLANIEENTRRLALGGGGLVPHMAAGGLITNGLWNVDSVIARHQSGGSIALAGGEFVTRAPSVNPATLPTLAHINETGRTPANDNLKELARVIMRENRALREEVAALRAEFGGSMKRLADVTRQTGNQAQQQRRAG